MDQPEPDSKLTQDESRKLIHKITHYAGYGFLVVGVLVFITGGDIILGSLLALVGITDLVLVPHIIETVILAKLNQKNENDKG